MERNKAGECYADCKDGYSEICPTPDISAVLDDLGYSATDVMNVNFVFIVEGKQDKSRFPLLLKKYFSETYDEDGNLSRIAIITTNSCTNIKAYANLKYMNQVYLKDNFRRRDGDGKDREKLKGNFTNIMKSVIWKMWIVFRASQKRMF